MSITTHPVQNESAGQLGKVKSNARPYIDADTQLRAEQWNAVCQRLIEVHGEVGLTNGSEAGTVNARVKGMEAALPTNSDATAFWDDFLDAATGDGWQYETNGDADAGIAPSASALMAFPSRGIAGLFVHSDAADGSKTSLAKIGAGLMFSDTTPIRLLFRSSRPFAISDFTVETTDPEGTVGGTFMWGMVGGFTEDGPTVGVVLRAGVDEDNHRAWSIMLIDGDPEAPTVTSIDMPTCTFFEARITGGADGLEVEVSPDGGAFESVYSSETPIQDGVYIPYLFAERAAGGNQGVLVDGVGGSGVRSTTHAGDPAQGTDWPHKPLTQEDLDDAVATEAATRAAADAALAFPGVVTETGTTRALTDADDGKVIRCTNSAGCTITVPDTLTPSFGCAAFPDHATGSVTWDQSGTMVLQNSDGFLISTARYALSGVTVHSATLGIVSGAVDS